MADVKLKNVSGSGADGTIGVNGTDKIRLIAIDDYSKMGLEVTTSAGVATIYEVVLVERT